MAIATLYLLAVVCSCDYIENLYGVNLLDTLGDEIEESPTKVMVSILRLLLSLFR